MWNISVLVNKSNDTEETWTTTRETLKEVLEDMATVVRTEPIATSFIFTLVPPEDK